MQTSPSSLAVTFLKSLGLFLGSTLVDELLAHLPDGLFHCGVVLPPFLQSLKEGEGTAGQFDSDGYARGAFLAGFQTAFQGENELSEGHGLASST